MGRAAFFIRTYGCPLHCPWCDSAGTWHKDYVPKNVERIPEAQLVQEMLETRAAFAVVTGGEPTIHDLRLLTATLHDLGRAAHLETAGCFEIKGTFDWTTLSPKRAKLPLAENVAKASEFKLIIETPRDIAEWFSFLVNAGYRGQPIWLHPEWSKRHDIEVLDGITEWVKSVGDNFRVGYQLHKLYKADALDKRSAPLVPLGGDPKRGY